MKNFFIVSVFGGFYSTLIGGRNDLQDAELFASRLSHERGQNFKVIDLDTALESFSERQLLDYSA